MSRKAFSFITVTAALIGVVFSLISLYQHVEIAHGLKVSPSFCNISAELNCDVVNASTWSTFLGFPLAGWGVWFYLLMGGLGLATFLQWVSLQRAAGFSLLVGGAASVFSVFLFVISKVVLDTVCLLCVGMYLCNFCFLGVGLGFGRSLSMGRRLQAGVVGVRDFFLAVFGRGNAGTSARARYGLVYLVLCAAVTALLPQYILLPQIKEEFFSRTGVENPHVHGFIEWKRAPEDPIEYGFPSASFNDEYRGDPDAPIRVLEYADFQCPACRDLYATLGALREEYGEGLVFVYRNYPLDAACNPSLQSGMHQHACPAAYFALCAGEQGRYWDAVDYLFQVAPFEDIPHGQPWDYTAAANTLGLDTKALQDCIGSNRMRSHIHREVKSGDDLGLRGTPLLYVNEKQVQFRSEETLRMIFDYILANE